MNWIIILFALSISVIIIVHFLIKWKKKIGLWKFISILLFSSFRKYDLVFEVFVASFFIVVLLGASIAFNERLGGFFKQVLSILRIKGGEIPPGILFVFFASGATFLSFYNTHKIRKEISKPIYDFDDLMDGIIDLVEKLSNYTLEQIGVLKPYLYVYSKTPSLGNISSPDKYKKFSRYLLSMTRKGIDVRVVCLDGTQFAKFHKNFTTDDTKANEWNQDATTLLGEIQMNTEHVSNPVINMQDISNTFSICTPKGAFEFIVMAEKVNGKNVIFGHRITNPRDIRFIKDAILQYWQ